jgi:hypothetical protein
MCGILITASITTATMKSMVLKKEIWAKVYSRTKMTYGLEL